MPTKSPSYDPSSAPSKSLSPSKIPSLTPTESPSFVPSDGPSSLPSYSPTRLPSNALTYSPSNCADIQNSDPSSEDGEYTITRKTDGVSRDINIYCHNMDSNPKEFLTLTELNYSQFKAGGLYPGTTVVTTFTKIRLDIATLKADINDHTFSTSVGKINNDGIKDYMPFGLAYSCIKKYEAHGKAEINLSGTPFKVISEFEVGGSKGVGSAVYNSASNLWNISGGGWCAWCIPKSGWNPRKFKPEEERFSLWLDFM